MGTRAGTKYAELLAKKFALFRTKGDALRLCTYTEATSIYENENHYLTVTYQEDVDCLVYSATTSKTVDQVEYNEIDKIIGFPWCNISKTPVINSIFVEKDTGEKRIVTGILSDDPIKGFVSVATKPLSISSLLTVAINLSERLILNVNAENLVSDMIYIRNNPAVTPLALTDEFVPISNTDVFPPALAGARPRVRVAYEASFQLTATGTGGGEFIPALQKSYELEAGPEVWADVDGRSGPITLAVGQTNKCTIKFHDTVPGGIEAGYLLKYRLVGKRGSVDTGCTIHDEASLGFAPPPTVSLLLQFNYALPAQVDLGTSEGLTFSLSETVEVAAGGMEAVEGLELGLTATAAAAAEIAVAEGLVLVEVATAEAAVDGIEAVEGLVLGTAESVEVAEIVDGVEGLELGEVATVDVAALVEAVEGLGLSTAESVEVAELVEGVEGLILGSVETVAVAAVGGSAAEGLVLGMEAACLAADVLWNAPAADPVPEALALSSYQPVTETLVTIPGNAAGLPRVRFKYSGSVALLATGSAGGDAGFRLRKSVGGAAFATVTGQESEWIVTNQDDEERVVFEYQDDFPEGIPANTEIRYQLSAETLSAAHEVTAHDSLIDPDNTAPVCFVIAEYFYV